MLDYWRHTSCAGRTGAFSFPAFSPTIVPNPEAARLGGFIMSFPDPNANQFDPIQPPKKGSPVVKIIIILAIVFGVIGLICCGLCGGGAYFSLNALSKQVENQLAGNPVIAEHIGNIESVKMNLQAAIELIQEKQAAGEPVQQNVVVFDIQGDKGEGQVIIITPPGGQPAQFNEGTLRMSTGEEYDLMPESVEMEPPEFDMEDAMDMDGDTEDS